MNDEPMAGKTCLITGATSGIGLVTARQLARRGATVIIVGRTPERSAATSASISRAPATRASNPCTPTSPLNQRSGA